MDKNDIFKMQAIGYVKCPLLKCQDDHKRKEKGKCFEAEVILDKSLAEAMDEIETFDHVWLIWVFNKNIDRGFEIKVRPRPDPDNQRGLFITRSPFRPNPIGMSCVKVTGRDDNILKFENSDILDGTPVLDIKPYIPSSDSRPDSNAGWISDLNL